MSENTEKELYFPEECRYNNDHIWMQKADNGNIVCGITGYLCEITGDIISLDYKHNLLNMQVSSGDYVFSLESIKETVGVNSPLAGVIIAINENCLEDPSIICSDPYNEGWLFIISADDYYEFEDQMYPDEYASLVVREKQHSS